MGRRIQVAGYLMQVAGYLMLETRKGRRRVASYICMLTYSQKSLHVSIYEKRMEQIHA